MNSLIELNQYSATTLDVVDSRLAQVKFDRTAWFDSVIDITALNIAVAPVINIQEVINYSTANCRFQVSIKSTSNPTFYTGSSIQFPTLPTGVTLTTSNGVYTLSGIKSADIWNQVKNFNWTLPSNYASNSNFYLESKIIWYSGELGAETSISWETYDPDFYFFGKLSSSFSLTAGIGYSMSIAANLQATFTMRPKNDVEMESRFTLLARPQGETYLMSANLSSTASMNIQPRIVKGGGAAIVSISTLATESNFANLTLIIDTRLATGTTFTLPIRNSSVAPNILIRWGDGTQTTWTNNTSYPSKTYSTEGTYTIRITGSLVDYGTVSSDYPSASRDMITGCSSFGNLGITDLSYAFYNSPNFASAPTVLPSSVTNIAAMFEGCTGFNDAGIGLWNTSNVTQMSRVFYGCTAFNQSINSWNTANVTAMAEMFYSCSNFNKPLTLWNTANNTRLDGTFALCTAFNQNINSWNTSKVTNMVATFFGCSNFNQPLNGWDVSVVGLNNMNDMFNGASVYDQNISNWEVTRFSSKPSGFDANTSAAWTTAEKPQWGV